MLNRQATRRVSVKDVARAAGVSTQTVSRVVNNAESVAPATRAKVTQAIQLVGYRRSELARNLNQGRTWTLGVVFAGHDELGGRQLNSGITAEAEALGYSLLITDRQGSTEVPAMEWLHGLLARQVDGILWMVSENAERQNAVIHELMYTHGVPVVGMATSPGHNYPIVSFDNNAAGILATRHLVERGRRVIGHISGRAGTWDARGRENGWREALRAAGLPAEPHQLAVGNWSPESGDRAFRQLLQQCPDLDAVFAANDSMALGALHAAHELGVSIPQQIAMVGVDNIKGAAYFTPSLTTIRQNQADLGRRAVRLLAALADTRFNGTAPPSFENVLQQPELLVRGSS